MKTLAASVGETFVVPQRRATIRTVVLVVADDQRDVGAELLHPPARQHIIEAVRQPGDEDGDARLVGLVRDPTTLLVYWDFSPQQIEQAFMGLGPARAVLKLWNARNGSGERGGGRRL